MIKEVIISHQNGFHNNQNHVTFNNFNPQTKLGYIQTKIDKINVTKISKISTKIH